MANKSDIRWRTFQWKMFAVISDNLNKITRDYFENAFEDATITTE